MVRPDMFHFVALISESLWFLDDIIYDHQLAPDDVLGLDHVAGLYAEVYLAIMSVRGYAY
jgi:hypothetical protein